MTVNGKLGAIGALAHLLVAMENKSVLEASLFQRHIEVERALALASKHEIVISKSVKVMIISYYDFRKCKSVEFIYIL